MATYYTYNEGVDLKYLRLGSLVHDYQFPDELEPFVESAYSDFSKPIPDWAQAKSFDDFALTLGRARENDILGPNGDVLGTKIYRVVAAKKATRIEITRPEEFFHKRTLASKKAKLWLSVHLAAAERLAQGDYGPRPQIWMLTGIIFMDHATWTRLATEDRRFVAGRRAPFVPGHFSVNDAACGHPKSESGLHVPTGHIIYETGRYPQMKGWAAQWQKVEIKVKTTTKSERATSSSMALKYGLQIAQVKVRDNIYARNDDEYQYESEDFNDKYWGTFLDEIQVLEKQLGGM